MIFSGCSAPDWFLKCQFCDHEQRITPPLTIDIEQVKCQKCGQSTIHNGNKELPRADK